MKSIVCIALVFAVIGLINAQAPPLATQQCVSVTGISFCTGVVSYPVLNNTVTQWQTQDSNANAQYTAAVAKITNSTACSNALQAYYCQFNFPRCTTYTNFNSIASTRCNAVNSACNITGFPSGGFAGSACINNMQASVDGNSICATVTTVNLGNTCNGAAFSPSNNGTFGATVCPVNTFCNVTDPNPTCLKPNNLGDACPTGVCYNGPLMGTTSLTCISGSCQYAGKANGYKCLANAECASNNCTSGLCLNSGLYGYCTSTSQCQTNLYCDLFNNTCLLPAQKAMPCGQLQTNWSPVPCVPGYTCVRGTGNQTLSSCVLNASPGQTCSPATGGVVYNSPLCLSTIFGNSGYSCINNTCVNVTPGTLGQTCSATAPCASTLTCQYPATNPAATSGTCANPSSVSCASTSGSPQCNTYQTCTCASATTAGTCAVSTTNPYAACATQVTNLQSCLFTNCNGANAPFIFYDQYSCGSTSCLAQVNALVCCAQGAQGSNFVAPTGTPPNVCATPSPTPGPTATGTGTPVPIQSSKKSGATTVVVSFVAMIIAVVAFCL